MTQGYLHPQDREAAQHRGSRDFTLNTSAVDDIGRALDKTFRELRRTR